MTKIWLLLWGKTCFMDIAIKCLRNWCQTTSKVRLSWCEGKTHDSFPFPSLGGMHASNDGSSVITLSSSEPHPPSLWLLSFSFSSVYIIFCASFFTLLIHGILVVIFCLRLLCRLKCPILNYLGLLLLTVGCELCKYLFHLLFQSLLTYLCFHSGTWFTVQCSSMALVVWGPCSAVKCISSRCFLQLALLLPCAGWWLLVAGVAQIGAREEQVDGFLSTVWCPLVLEMTGFQKCISNSNRPVWTSQSQFEWTK